MEQQPARKQLISIVTPCYNEEANVAHHLERVLKAVAPFRERYDFEHIYTDNVSRDATFEVLRGLAAQRKDLRAIRFSRNIGANRAIFFGLMQARGDAAILIQADLQDPPEMIPEFIRGWEEGNDVVYGQILHRQEGWLLQNCRKLYYWLVAKLADVPPPRNAGEFRIVSRRVLEAIAQYREEDLYLRGAIAHIGFRQKALPYVRQERRAGRSSSDLPYLFNYALNGLLSTSTVVPIRGVVVIGLVTSLAGFFYLVFVILAKVLFPALIPKGLASITAMITFFAGVQLFALGIIGEYIRKIYIQSLGRPLGFIQDRVGF